MRPPNCPGPVRRSEKSGGVIAAAGGTSADGLRERASEELVCDNEELICASEELVCDNEELICASEELVCDNEELICASEELIIDNKEFICASEELVLDNKEPICADEELVCDHEEPICAREVLICDHEGLVSPNEPRTWPHGCPAMPSARPVSSARRLRCAAGNRPMHPALRPSPIGAPATPGPTRRNDHPAAACRTAPGPPPRALFGSKTRHLPR